MRLHKENRAGFASVYLRRLQSKGSKVKQKIVEASVGDLDFGLLSTETDYRWFDFMGEVLVKKRKAKRAVDLRREGMELGMVRRAIAAEGWKNQAP